MMVVVVVVVCPQLHSIRQWICQDPQIVLAMNRFKRQQSVSVGGWVGSLLDQLID